jgi:circadian clock protein KaiC
MERITTGIDGLDLVLEGGLPRHAVHIFAGVPGTGKSTVALQIAFRNATAGRPALYLTTLSEPLPKLIGFLQEFAFADVSRIGTEVLFDSLDEILRENPDQLPAKLLGLIQRHRPGLIVLDSFKAIGDVISDASKWRSIMFEVAGALAAYDATALLVGEYTEREMIGLVEFAVADGVIELRREQRGSRDERFLRVAKLRGSSFLDGTHAFTLARQGVRVFPRLVGPPAPLDYVPDPQRLASGIGGLDEMIDNGWLRGSSTLVLGPSGSGKTILGLHFLRQGVAEGEPSLLVTFQETPTQLRRAIRSLGWSDRELLAAGKFDLLYRSPVELQIDTVVHEIFERIERDGVRRIVIDALGDLERAAGDPIRFSDYIYALAQHLASAGVSCMFLLETDRQSRGVLPDLRPGVEKAIYIVDNLLALGMELEGELTRSIRILKTRGSAHDGGSHTLMISRAGLEVAGVRRRARRAGPRSARGSRSQRRPGKP